MKNFYGWGLLMSLAFIGNGAKADDVTQAAPFVSLRTSGFSVRIAPQWAWTLDTIAYGGKVVAEPSGLYGLVIDVQDGKFVGSGHHEGGSEKVLDVQLEADGKTVDYLHGGEISGEKFIFTKTAKLNDLSLKSVLRISADEIEGEHFVRVDKDTKVTTMYAFMFPWLASTNEWIGETIDGKPLEGKFENKGFILHDKLRWCAVYEPALKTAAITYFQSHKEDKNFLHFFNDHAAYHKQYFKTMTSRELKAGEEFHYVASLLAVVAEASEWKEKARQKVNSFQLKSKPATQ